MSTARAASLLLRADAVANAALAVVILAALGWLTGAAGLDSGWPLVVLAGVLIANGTLCWRTASPAGPAPRPLRGLAAGDMVFIGAVALFALADPTGAATWLRIVLAVLAVGVTAVAAAKALLAARLSPARAPRS